MPLASNKRVYNDRSVFGRFDFNHTWKCLIFDLHIHICIRFLISASIQIESINGILAEEMIDASAEDDLYIDGDVRFEHLSVTGDLFGELESPCDLMEAVKSYGTLPAKRWNSVIVRGGVNWDYGGGNITRILEEAVLRDRDTVVESVVRGTPVPNCWAINSPGMVSYLRHTPDTVKCRWQILY